jgi:hypothetical protein
MRAETSASRGGEPFFGYAASEVIGARLDLIIPERTALAGLRHGRGLSRRSQPSPHRPKASFVTRWGIVGSATLQ